MCRCSIPSIADPYPHCDARGIGSGLAGMEGEGDEEVGLLGWVSMFLVGSGGPTELLPEQEWVKSLLEWQLACFVKAVG